MTPPIDRESELLRQVHILYYRTKAQIKAESQNNYLGYLWFLLEPILTTAVLYFVFGFLLGNRGPEAVLFILVGILVWQWFSIGFTSGMAGIREKLTLLQSVRVPKYLFPLVNVLAASWKFIWVFLVLIVLANGMGFFVNPSYFWLPLPLLVTLLLIAGLAIPFSIAVAFMPDLTTFVNSILRLLFFLSGIFFTVEVVPPHLRDWFLANPIASLMTAFRAILIDGQRPDLLSLGYCSLWGLGGLAVGLVWNRLAEGKIVKSVSQ